MAFVRIALVCIVGFAVSCAIVAGFLLPFVVHHVSMLVGIELFGVWAFPTGGWIVRADASKPIAWYQQAMLEASAQFEFARFLLIFGAISGAVFAMLSLITKRIGGQLAAVVCGALPGLPLFLFVFAQVVSPIPKSGNPDMDASRWFLPLVWFIKFIALPACAAAFARHVLRKRNWI